MMSASRPRSRRLASLFASGLALSPALGCVLLIREPEAYQEDVVELVSAGDDAIQACYDQVLQARQSTIEVTEREAQGPYADIGPAIESQLAAEQGLVVVRFEVEAKTGKLHDPRVDAAQTTASAPAVDCVLASLEGLVLEDPDHKAADVTLAWQLKVGKARKAAPVDEEPSAELAEGTLE
jgi:hypothetical protein